MSVHYKFKSALDFDTITFDGLHISVSDLKKAIIHQKRLGKTADFDLQITNAQTKEEYTDDGALIPKNTSLIIARIPLAVQPKKPWDPQADKVQGVRQVPEPDSGTLDLSQMNGTEEDKIQAMMIQSTMDYDPNNYQKIRGQGQTGEVPANYRCFKCHKPGHWIKNCPLGSSGETIDVKRNTGIPRSFIERDSHEKNAEQQPQPPPPVPEKKQEIPEDLICSICKDLFTDAVMIPCCGSSFCDECVRTALLESEDNECPDCKEKGSSPGSLIPNRFLRNSVNAFKNETGYNKPRQRKEPVKPKETTTTSTSNQAEHPEKSIAPPESTSKDNKVIQDEKEKDTTKEKKDQDGVEKKADAGALSSHDESDFEDNITVTLPPAHLQGPIGFKERQYNGRHSRHPKPPGLESSPKSGSNSQTTPPREHRSGTPTIDEKDTSSDAADQPQKHHPVPSHQSSSRDSSMRTHRSTPSEVYGNGPPITSYPQGQPMMGPGRPYDMGVYGVPPGPGYPPYMMGDRMRGPYHPPRPGYPHMHQMRPRHMAPPGTLASVYQGVAAKVGTGIIDDPLEAFNRIMREKEKRKEERRRSPDRRRSRSIEMNLGRMRHSPPQYNRGRIRSPEERRLRTPPPRERRGRSREREKRSLEKEKRRHRSSSFSDRSSRSRSWSIPPRRRTKSPPVVRRRSRSRSPSFSISRSRSRSNSQGRFRGPAPPMRYNRSPLRQMSPRYRQKENRRPERREEFPKDDFRERSPYHYQSRRPRSRGRMMSPGPHRQDRPPGHGQDPFYHQLPPVGMYNEAPYSQNNNRYQRDGPMIPHREPYPRDRNVDYKMERFDDGPPGTDEPPPPGFENSPERVRRNSWNHNQFDDHGYRDDYRKQEPNKKDYIERAHTPELREIQSIEREERHRHEVREREGRSWSRTSRHSPNNTRRRRSRSRSPLRLERIPEHYPNRDRNPSKERHTNRERYSQERQMHVEKERVEHEKQRERAERDRKNLDKKHSDRKGHEKESRHVSKEEKEKEKYREQEREKEKEKRRESSEEEKKDRKTKEKRKKKKEKDPEKKKKKEKKEKEKKLKEKEKEREKEEEKEKEKEKEVEKEKEQICEKELSIEKVIPEEKPEEEPPRIEEMESDKTNEAEETGSMREEGELPDDDDEETPPEKDKEPEIIDLYGDICQEEEIRYDYTSNSAENIEAEGKPQKDINKVSPTDIKRFDSVLDIHDFEPDLDEIGKDDTKRDNSVLVPLPELSKWEREEENQAREEKRTPSISEASVSNEEKTGKVTTEVIRRAENAIFARAINAIRPIEIKKISVERQKLYANEPLRDLTSPPSVLIKSQSPNKELPSFQITVPANSNSSERSVEIKSDKQKRLTPVRSVKDRLGSKVTEPIPKRNRSRSNTPPRKITIEGSRVEKVRVARSRSRERHRGEDNRDARRGSEIRRVNETNRSRDRNQKDYKMVDNNRGREQPRPRENDRRREHPRERSRDHQWEQERLREREREREREKEKAKERRRTPERSRDRPRDRERHIPREQERVRERQRSPSGDNKSKERHRSKEREKTKQRDEKRERSRSRSSERKDKRNKRDKDTKRKRSEEGKSQEREKRTKIEKVERESKEKNLQRKKSLIDEASFVPDYDEQPDQEHLHKTNEGSEKKTERSPKEKMKSPDSNKRSHSASASSSSSSSSDSDSDSDSDDNKKKKKRKHKKKKSKRASSAESGTSTKHKRSKSKKKSKSSKKKKKSKK